MADVDRIASAELGIPLELLMENASHQIGVAARLFLGGGVAGKRIVALAGNGNNGGDALGALRHLSGWGADVRAVLSGPVERLRPLARRQHDILATLGVRVDAAAVDAHLLIDGLLGYSIAGPPRDAVSDLIRAANASRLPILAVDLPSGMHPDTGEPLGITIRAALTVTLALPKRGLMTTRSRALVGELLLADIGIPPLAFDRVGIETRGLFESGELVRIIR